VSTYLYIPLRAATDPVLNWGEPDTLPRLLDALLQKQYSGKMLNPDWGAKANILSLIGWSMIDEAGPVIFALALAGLALLGRRRPSLLIGLLLLVAANVALRINYIGVDEEFQVRRYLISSYLVLIVGFAWLLSEVQNLVVARLSPAWGRQLAFLGLAILAAWPVMRHARANEQSGNWVAYEAWQNALSHPASDYVLFVGGDNNLFPAVVPADGRAASARRDRHPARRFRQRLGHAHVRPAPAVDDDRRAPGIRRLARGRRVVSFHPRQSIGDSRTAAGFRFRRRYSGGHTAAFRRAEGANAHAARGRAHLVAGGGGREFDPARVWRYYQTASLTDATLARDHHTQIVAEDYGAYFDYLAQASAQRADFAGATYAYQRALLADPHNDVVMVHWANQLAAGGRFTEAIELYERAIKIAPNDWRHYHNLAIILKRPTNPSEPQRCVARASVTRTEP
jgi:tetratricopeptide (TPR) repeat protein